MSQHARLSASESRRWMHCAGSIGLSAKVDRTGNAAATLGTSAHAFAEGIIKGSWEEYELKHGTLFGMEFEFEDDGIIKKQKVDMDMLEAVEVYVDFLREQSNGFKFQVHLEMDLSLEHLHPDMNICTSDAVILRDDGILVVADYKNGMTPVPLEYDDGPNSQLMYYAAAVLHKLNYPNSINLIRLAVIQPRCWELARVRTLDISTRAVQEWARKVLKKAAERVDSHPNEFVVGDWCEWCRGQSLCQAFNAKVTEVAGADFAEVGRPRLPDVSSLTREQRINVLKWAPLLDSFIREVEAKEFELALRGDPPEGYKVVRKKSNRKWRSDDPQAVHRELIAAGLHSGKFPSALDICNVKLKSPSQVEKLFKDNKKVVAKVAFKPEGSLTLTTIDDPRDAVDIKLLDPGQDFSELKEDNDE